MEKEERMQEMKPRDYLTPLNEINVKNPLLIREQIAARVEVGEHIIETATKADRDLNDSEQKEFDGLMSEVGSYAERTGLHGRLQLAEERERLHLSQAKPPPHRPKSWIVCAIRVKVWLQSSMFTRIPWNRSKKRLQWS